MFWLGLPVVAPDTAVTGAFLTEIHLLLTSLSFLQEDAVIIIITQLIESLIIFFYNYHL
jgi:hypothetical protein